MARKFPLLKSTVCNIKRKPLKKRHLALLSLMVLSQETSVSLSMKTSSTDLMWNMRILFVLRLRKNSTSSQLPSSFGERKLAISITLLSHWKVRLLLRNNAQIALKALKKLMRKISRATKALPPDASIAISTLTPTAQCFNKLEERHLSALNRFPKLLNLWIRCFRDQMGSINSWSMSQKLCRSTLAFLTQRSKKTKKPSRMSWADLKRVISLMFILETSSKE